MTEDWTKWESLVINGVYPLRRFLTRSDHSVVFLTEYTQGKAADAAIKLIPADPAGTEAQLAQWQAMAALSHPHLMRIFDSGRCKLGGHPFLFVVMEYAEQNLAQILPHRALTLDEVRELLPPTIDALGFLHARNLVHCRLQPPNFLVVDDALKLSSDGVRRAEDRDGRITPAADIWALGATLVEALTQHRPDERGGTIALPDTLPPAFADTVRRCLSANPADRPAITDLDAQFKGAPAQPVIDPVTPPAPAAPTAAPAPPTAAPPPTAASAPPAAAPTARAIAPTPPVIPVAPRVGAGRTLPRKRLLVPAIAAALVLLTVAWAGSRLFRSHPRPQAPPAASNAPSAAQPAVPAVAPAAASQNEMAVPAAVVHQELPEVSRRARASVRGTIKVSVRVTVDRSGKVIAQSLVNRGSSRYFARVAGEAAKKWRFAADNPESRQWLLQFEFTRDGTTAHAAPRL